MSRNYQSAFASARLWLLMALCLAIAPFALACGDDDDNGATDGVATAVNTVTGGSPTGSGSPGANDQPGAVSVMGIWGGEELTSFEAMTRPWEARGGDVSFTGTRNITADLTLRVEGGSPPDVAIPAEVGLFQQFAREGKLISLDQCPGLQDTIEDKYPEGFRELATIDGKLYGFFMKADTKGTIWYNPKVFEQNNIEPLDADSSFDDLVRVSEELRDKGIAPWSIGVESAEASGWPGSDWLQQILLNQEGGEDTYDGLIDGSVKFTDQKVKDAWRAFERIALGDGMTVQGGAEGINATNFQDSAYPPFQDPPQAAMLGLGGFASGFITTQFPNLKAEDDFDFFTWPGGKITGGANIVYAFNDKPATCSFLNYLASADAQEIWVKEGGFTSVNSDVDMEAYPNPIARKQAEQLIDAETFRFDLDDAIGGDLQNTYFAGVTEFLSDPSKLDQILAEIEAARQ